MRWNSVQKTAMAEHLLKVCGLTKDQVAALVGGSQTEHPRTMKFGLEKKTRVSKAYDMVVKGSTVSAACQSWGVTVKAFNEFAMTNNLPLASSYRASPCRSEQAWKDAQTMGVREACKKNNVSRFAMYAYARRYGLPTPLRAKYK